MTKTKSVEKILKLTKKVGQEKYFDKVNDMEDSYRNKILKAIEKIAK